MRKFVLAAVLAAGVMAAGSRADAQDLLRAGTHPGYASIGTGPSMGINFLSGGAFFIWNFNLGVGYHFSGNSGGAAIGGDIGMRIPAIGGFQMTFAPRFTYDIQIGNTGIYIGPTVAIGLGFVTSASGSGFALEPSVGVDIKFVLGDRGLLFVRPLNFGFPIWMSGTGVLGNMAIDFVNFGGGVTF